MTISFVAKPTVVFLFEIDSAVYFKCGKICTSYSKVTSSDMNIVQEMQFKRPRYNNNVKPLIYMTIVLLLVFLRCSKQHTFRTLSSYLPRFFVFLIFFCSLILFLHLCLLPFLLLHFSFYSLNSHFFVLKIYNLGHRK